VRGRTSQIWRSAADGTERRRLTPDDLDAHTPIVARSAGTIVFTACGDDRIPHVFRMDPRWR
jgi:hypothetical protein